MTSEVIIYRKPDLSVALQEIVTPSYSGSTFGFEDSGSGLGTLPSASPHSILSKDSTAATPIKAARATRDDEVERG